MASGGGKFKVPRPLGPEEDAPDFSLSGVEQDQLASEVAESVTSNTLQLEKFIIELTDKLIHTGNSYAQAAVIQAWQNTYKGVSASGARVEVLDAVEYESEDDTHLFANKTQQQPEAPAETPVE